MAEYGEEQVWKMYDDEERGVMRRFLEHGRAVRAERERAGPPQVKRRTSCRSCANGARFHRLPQDDAGLSCLTGSIHEEIIKSLEEGISSLNASIRSKRCPMNSAQWRRSNSSGRNRTKMANWRNAGEFITLPARTVCVAAGTSPNIIYEKSVQYTFKLDRWNQFFQGYKLVENGTRHLEPISDGSHEVGFFNFV